MNAQDLGNERVASNPYQCASVIQVVAASIDQLNEIITCISTLVIQVNSDTVNATEREGVDTEAPQQFAQFNKILETTD